MSKCNDEECILCYSQDTVQNIGVTESEADPNPGLVGRWQQECKLHSSSKKTSSVGARSSSKVATTSSKPEADTSSMVNSSTAKVGSS